MHVFNQQRLRPILGVFAAGVLLALGGDSAAASSLTFDTDPLGGTTVRNTPGRQVVGSEQFIAFHTLTEEFVFNGSAFALNDLRFSNGTINNIPTNANVIVLQTTDNDNNLLTPFGAGNAADLLANQITTSGPGLFIYFNSSLSLARLVYSDDLSSNTADLRILARMLSLNNKSGLDEVGELPNFSAENFQLRNASEVPEPSSSQLICGGIALLGLGALRRRATGAPDGLQASRLMP